MKIIAKFMFATAAYLLFSGTMAAAASQPPAEGGLLPEILLTAPQKTELQEYLGVTGKKTFAIPEIKAEVVIIEIFSMY
jgi:hypothetical protein